MEEEINLLDFFKLIKKRLSWFLVGGVAGLLLAMIYTFMFIPEKYEASASVLVNKSAAVTEPTIKSAVQSTGVLDIVIQKLDLKLTSDQLLKTITVEAEKASQVFVITTQNSDPTLAANISNTIANVFKDKATTTIADVKGVNLISPAVPNFSRLNFSPLKNFLVGIILGKVLAGGLLFLFFILDKTVQNQMFIENQLEWVNLGAISSEGEEDQDWVTVKLKNIFQKLKKGKGKLLCKVKMLSI